MMHDYDLDRLLDAIDAYLPCEFTDGQRADARLIYTAAFLVASEGLSPEDTPETLLRKVRTEYGCWFQDIRGAFYDAREDLSALGAGRQWNAANGALKMALHWLTAMQRAQAEPATAE